MAHRPNCRYGHGDLIDANQVHGVPVTYGLILQPLDDPTRETIFQHGLNWLVCATCGYSELQDTDVAQTIENMGPKS